MVGRMLGATLLVAALSSSALAQQRVTLTVAAGQPPAALPSLALVTSFFIPEVNRRIKDANINFTIDWKEAIELLQSAPHVPPLLMEIEGAEGQDIASKMAEAYQKLDGVSV